MDAHDDLIGALVFRVNVRLAKLIQDRLELDAGHARRNLTRVSSQINDQLDNSKRNDQVSDT